MTQILTGNGNGKEEKSSLQIWSCCYGFCHSKWSLIKNCSMKNHTEFLWGSSSVHKPRKAVSLALNHTNGRRKSWIYGRAAGQWYRASCYHLTCLWDNSIHCLLKWWIKSELLDGMLPKLMILQVLVRQRIHLCCVFNVRDLKLFLDNFGGFQQPTWKLRVASVVGHRKHEEQMYWQQDVQTKQDGSGAIPGRSGCGAPRPEDSG